MDNKRLAPQIEQPLRHLLDPSYPLCREDVLWALGFIKKKVADGAPEWSGLDRPQLLAHFACFADMALLLLHRRSPSNQETECFRAMLSELLKHD
ncbi:hypothetical protein [Cohnella silvisoli]|uniref:Uncharacterized protein n=1 Tax=Cohnella silvisoli TaxID=2873699 RepID=A0ABV1KZ28_9BACL|nr:hypothetical protein [Cohnella silvisoli]